MTALASEAEASASSKGQGRRVFLVVVSINLVLSILLWFGFVTNVEFSVTWLNVLFPFLVLAVTVWSYRRRRTWSKWRQICLLAVATPGFVGAFCYALVVGLLCLMILPAGFWIGEQASSFRVERLVSPDGARKVDVVFVPVGAYSGGYGRVEIFERWDRAPFLRRQIGVLRADDAVKPGDRVMEWVDAETLRLRLDGTEVPIGSVDWRDPFFVLVITSLCDIFTS